MKAACHLTLLLAIHTATGATLWRNGKSYDFPIYTNNPPGRQLAGGHAPADTPPLPPEETQKKFKVPPGFEVRLFAAEPEVVNPVAMTWDDRGRLWVLELYEYPKGAARGERGRDRIKILEDTDADGRADKVSVFADGYSLATGLAVGHGGVFLGVAPNLLFLEDTDGDDRADKTTVLMTGFGLEDRHELLNSFTWGPDGWLYLTHGVFTHSTVRNPDHAEDDGVRVDAALARFHPVSKTFEVFADGTSNPWGVDWNGQGDAFVSACVIMHLFHMAPGGLYNRQGGTWPNPYGYVQDLPSKGLPAIVDWRHYRAAHAGICLYQGNQYPAQWQELAFLGNIHQNAINCDRLEPVGATYRATKESDLLGPSKGNREVGAGNFLVCSDPWFRPVSNQTGPDGALWIMDWADRYPCYQNAQADPGGVDREYGRIWRVVHTGAGRDVPSRPQKNMNLAKLSTESLVALLGHPNSWQRRHAQRVLSERRDPNSLPALEAVVKQGTNRTARLAALWTLHSSDLCRQGMLNVLAANDPDPVLRAWAARLTGERRTGSTGAFLGLEVAVRDSDPRVRAAAATALRQHTSGSLTVQTPTDPSVSSELIPANYFPLLLSNPSVPGDFFYPHIVWMAMEPRVRSTPQEFFPWLAANENDVSAYCTRRIMRRICDLAPPGEREQHLDAALRWLGQLASKTRLAEAGLDGLIEAFKAKSDPPSIDLQPIFDQLASNPALADKVRRLATLLGDTTASRLLMAQINNPAADEADRLKGIQAARDAKDEAARDELVKLISTEKESQPLLLATVRALSVFGNDEIAYPMVEAWPRFNLSTRRAAAELLVTRTKWARALLAGLDTKRVDPQDISATARRALAHSADSTIVDHAEKLLGRYRAVEEDKLKLIREKRAVVLAGDPDIAAGHEVAKRACFVCHKLYGEGADIGPDLTGVGRSTLDALLHNIIAPNEVVGNGFEATEVELKDGTVLSGRVVEDTPTRLKLLATGPVEHLIAKSDIAEAKGQTLIRKLEMSLMPEGLEQMPDADFRNMIYYLLNPPQDNRPWTPALRQELIGPTASRSVDLESVSLWNLDWKINCPPFEDAPMKLAEHLGRKNVLMTHPISRETPCSLERTLEVPSQGATLIVTVAAHDRGDWELRVGIDDRLVAKHLVTHDGLRWKRYTVDLANWAGRRVQLRLENAANDWAWEFGYWGDISISDPRSAGTQAGQ